MHGTIGAREEVAALSAVRHRLQHIDAMRALALLGVIVMNIGSMVMFVNGRETMSSATPADLGVAAADLLVLLGKARSCFAFLFGAGFAIMMLRAEASGRDFSAFFTRRMAVLLLFGLINQIFLFWGDILVTYSLLGFALMLVMAKSTRWLLRAGLALALLPPLVHALIEIAVGHPLTGLIEPDRMAESARRLSAYSSPSYFDAVVENARSGAMEHVLGTAHMLVYDFSVFGLFLLGSWAVQTGILIRPGDHRPLLRRIVWVTLPLGLLLSGLNASSLLGLKAQGLLRAAVTASFVGVPILAFAYLALLGLWFSRSAKRLQAFLAPAGRMSLTNYLLSGTFGCWYFYGYGLGQLRAHSLAGLTLVGVGIWLAVVLFSHAWLSLFPMGPAEFLWRRWSNPAARKPARQAASAA